MVQPYVSIWRECRSFSLLLIGLSLVACGKSGNNEKTGANAPTGTQSLAVTTVAWDAHTLELGLSGSIGVPSPAGTTTSLSVTDADTREVLATVPLVTGQNAFSVVLDELTSVPCALTVTLGTASDTASVLNAPVGCAQLVNPLALTLTVREAEWENDRTLEIKGVAPVPNTVEIRYAGSDVLLSEVPVNDLRGRTTGIWKVKFTGFDASKVPCAVTVTAGGETQEVAVDGATSSCIGAPDTTPPPPQPNQAPTGTITIPASDVTVTAGSAVTFAGSGTDPDNNVPLSYLWDFGTGAPSSAVDNPGAVMFATAGTYTVKLTVTDSLGLVDPNPPTRNITVTAVNQPPVPVNQQPIGSITSPAADVTLIAGESVTFEGNGVDPDNDVPLSYAWNFGGGAPNVATQNPGVIAFSVPGTFNVVFTVTDAQGAADPNPPKRTVTVNAAAATAPQATITAPATDVEIAAGGTVTFMGAGTDSAGLALTYAWNFAGGATNASVAEPGAVVMDVPGIYPVTFTVTNANGVSNTVEATRTITVTAPVDAAHHVLVGSPREGLSTPDVDYTVLSLLPLNNSLQSQILETNLTPTTLPKLLDNTAISATYKATVDSKNAITTTSAGKTNFWPNVDTQFAFMLPTGITLLPDQGLQGQINSRSQNMPGSSNVAQPQSTFNIAGGANVFEARAIPLVPLNDASTAHSYPLFQLEAKDTAGVALAQLDIVLPVGNAMDCATGCHVTGGIAADDAETARLGGGIIWSTNTDPANQAKENIWIIHFALHAQPAVDTTNDSCARCHYTPLADPDNQGPQGTQQTRRPKLSTAIHRIHGLSFSAAPPSVTAPPIMADDQCATCHETGGVKISRGAMLTAGASCKDCHGGLLAVAAETDLVTTPPRPRVPYVDQPRCESCHIGDAVSVTSGPLVLSVAYDAADPAATARQATTSRYAQEPGKGFVTSTGHGKLTCPACHGVTHAEWPVDDPAANDNVTPTQLQGHRGVLTECRACHVGGVDSSTLAGPHGLHAINDPGWVAQHGPVYTASPAMCQACHGLTLDGDYLARAAIARNFVKSDGSTISYSTGQVIGCADCHAKPVL